MTRKEMYDKATKNGYDDVARFMRDMKKAGFKNKIYFYRGRCFWEGPAVNCDNIQTILSKTRVSCIWDNMGLGYVVYPKQSLNISKQLFGE